MRTWRIGFLTIRGGSGVLATLIILTAVALGFFPAFVQDHLSLNTEAIVGNLELWQVATWMIVPQRQVFSILIGVVIVLGMGSQLEMMWGTLRFWRVLGGIMLATGVLTALTGLVSKDIRHVVFDGVSVVVLIIWVGTGLQRRNGPINFWGINLTGYTFAAVGFGLAFFSGLFASTWIVIIPDVIAAIATFLVVHEGFPANALLRLKNWRLQRDLDKRSAHLRSIDGGQRNVGRDSDKYLH